MADVDLRAFLPFVLPDVQGCSDIAAVNAIRSACIEFCETTMLWTWDYGPDDVYAGESCYQAYGPGNANIHVILQLWFNGRQLEPGNTGRLPIFPASEPFLFEGGPAGQYTLYPTPSESLPNSISGRVVLKPRRDSDDCPEFLMNDWAETIGAGAKARLMSTPGKPWTAPDFAGKYLAEFRAGIGKAIIASNRSQTTAALSVSMSPFA